MWDKKSQTKRHYTVIVRASLVYLNIYIYQKNHIILEIRNYVMEGAYVYLYMTYRKLIVEIFILV